MKEINFGQLKLLIRDIKATECLDERRRAWRGCGHAARANICDLIFCLTIGDLVFRLMSVISEWRFSARRLAIERQADVRYEELIKSDAV